MSSKLGKSSSLRSQSGFSIFEGALVVVFIAIVIATVMAAMSLHENGKVKMQMSQFKQYKAAYDAFKTEYKAVPGDYNMASKKWDSVPNGDGNGRINEDAATVDSINKEYEMVKFFQHLYSSKYIYENFYNSNLLNIGYPTIKLDPSKGMLAYGSEALASFEDLQISKSIKRFNVALGLNVSQPDLGNGDKFNDFIGTSSPAIYAKIDKKIDDGNPRDGVFIVHQAKASSQGSCLDAVDGKYFSTNEKPACMALYILDE